MNNAKIELHDSLQNMHSRSLIPSNPKYYIPVAIGEFTKELFTNPLLEEAIQTILDKGEEAFMSFQKAKVAVLKELHATIQSLFSYKDVVPEFVLLNMEY